MKIDVHFDLCIDVSSISRVLENTIGGYDLYCFSHSPEGHKGYITLKTLTSLEFDLPVETLIQTGFAHYAEKREELQDKYQSALAELTRRENDLRMIGHSPVVHTSDLYQETNDDIPF